MAVLNVQVFALNNDTLTSDDQFTIYECFTCALLALAATAIPGVVVIGSDVIPYDTGAVVHVVAMADSAEQVTDAVAVHLDTAMAETPDLFTGWQLMAGDTTVWCSDN